MQWEHWFYTIPLRLRSLFRRKQVDRDLDDEMRFHLEQQIRANLDSGMTPEEARLTASRSIGGVSRVKEECRDMRKVNYFENLVRDAAYALRSLRKTPGFAAIAILTLALGIGANTAIFSLVSAVLLRPLPYHEPNRLVIVWEDASQVGFPRNTPAPANFADWKAQNKVFEQMAAVIGENFNLTGDGDPEKVEGVRATANLFPLLGVKPVLGRTFLAEEDTPESNKVVVIAYGLWQRRFGGDPELVGRTIRINGEPHAVVGVMPANFQFPSKESELWVPAAFTPVQLTQRGSHYLTVIGRLKPGVSLTRAQAEMSAIAKRLEQQYPGTNKNIGAVVVPLHEEYAGGSRLALSVLLATVGAVLLIACANIANLLLARGTARRREMSVRVALGAGRGRMIRQVLTESLVLAGLGAVLGVGLAKISFQFLAQLIPESFPSMTRLSLDPLVLGFTAGISLLTGIIFGLIPAMQAARIDMNEALKQGAGRGGSIGSGHGRFRTALVIAEVSLTLVLLVTAGLLIKSYSRLRGVAPGFRAENVLVAETVLPPSKYAELPRRAAFYQEVLERTRALPGVISAGYVSFPPLTMKGGSSGFLIEGRPEPRPGQLPVQDANNRIASAGYLPTMGIPLISGRYLDERDGADSPPVVVINQTMARTFWPNEDAIGKRIRTGRPERPWITIAGIVGDVKQMGLDVPARSEMYFPATQPTPAGPFFWPKNLVVRTAGDPMKLAAPVRREILSVDPEQPVSNIRTMEEILDGEVSGRRLQTALLAAFAGLALLLASVGMYGVLSYTVAQRTGEIGLRMALGARQGDVLRMVVGRGMLMVAVGIAAGAAAAFALTRMISSLLFGVEAADPATFAIVAILLVAVGLIASYVPARRAANLDPMIALRHE